MEPRTEPPTIDLAALERTLVQRACWHEDPAAYREGVRDTVEELRRSTAQGDRPASEVVAV